MKRLLFLSGLLTAMIHASAQQVNYSVTKDDPSNAAGFVMNFDLFQMDMSKNLGGSSFNIGVWGAYRLNSKIGIDYTWRKSWLTFGRLDDPTAIGNNDVEGGATLQLFGRKVSRDLKVVLKVTSGIDNQGNSVTNTTYIMVPGTVKKTTNVRGGFIMKRNPYEWERDNDVTFTYEDGYDPMTSMGLYSGLSFDRFTNLHIKADSYGHCMNSVGSRFYMDLLLMPVNTSKYARQDNNNPLGFRMGWQVFQAYRKADTGKNMGVAGDFQIGVRPYTGFFVTGSLGFTLVKR